MKTLVVFAHPKHDSFNHIILDTAVKVLENCGHEVRVKDLYEEKMNTILDVDDFQAIYAGKIPSDILKEQSHIAWAERLVFIYPLWWWDRPAILKGWIDRFWSFGFAYTSEKDVPQGLLKHEKALVIVTAGTSEEDFKKQNMLDSLHRPMIDGTLRFCGIQDVTLKTFYQVRLTSDTMRKEMLTQIEHVITSW